MSDRSNPFWPSPTYLRGKTGKVLCLLLSFSGENFSFPGKASELGIINGVKNAVSSLLAPSASGEQRDFSVSNPFVPPPAYRPVASYTPSPPPGGRTEGDTFVN